MYHVNAGSVSGTLEVHAASIFMAELITLILNMEEACISEMSATLPTSTQCKNPSVVSTSKILSCFLHTGCKEMSQAHKNDITFIKNIMLL
jgi:hypothetical protein